MLILTSSLFALVMRALKSAGSSVAEMLDTLSEGLVTSPTIEDDGFTQEVVTSLPYRLSSFGELGFQSVKAVLCDEDLHFIDIQVRDIDASFYPSVLTDCGS